MNTINNPPSSINKIAQINRLLQLNDLKSVKELLVLLLRYFPLDIVAGSNVTIEKDTNFSVYKITASGSGTTLLLQTEGVDNPVQTLLNLVAGTNMTITDDGAGNITFDASGGGATYTVDNGLTESPANNFQWGGTLIQNTVIDSGTFFTLFTGNRASPNPIVAIQNTGTGSGLSISTNYTTLRLTSNYSSLNTVEDNLQLIRTAPGLVASGIGQAIQFRNQSSSGSFITANKIISEITDVTPATFTSKMRLVASLNALDVDVLTLFGNGQLQANNYGVGTFVTAPTYALGVDASGNVIEFTGGGSSPLTTKGDLFTFDTADARLPVGLDTQVLLADSTTATGLKWGSNTTPPASGYYGQYFSYITQNATTTNVGVAMIFGTLDLSNGITVVTDGTNDTKITFAHTGIYNLQFSTQFQNTDNAEQDVYIWLRKNGTTSAADVLGSTGLISIPKTHGGGSGTPGHVIVTWNFLLDIVAGDFYQIVWSTSNVTNVSIKFLTATVNHPSTASTLFTVTQQAGILAGTGITAINSLTASAQTLTVGTTGTDFAIVDSGVDHKFNLPTASATNRGALQSSDFSNFQSAYTNRITSLTTTGTGAATLISNVLNIPTPVVPSAFITYRRLAVSSTLDATDLANVNLNAPYVVEMDVGTANNLTIPLFATVAFPIGSQITVSQYGAGQTTIVATVGVTLRSTGNFLKLAAQYSMCTLMKVGTNEWYVVGQLAP